MATSALQGPVNATRSRQARSSAKYFARLACAKWSQHADAAGPDAGQRYQCDGQGDPYPGCRAFEREQTRFAFKAKIEGMATMHRSLLLMLITLVTVDPN